MSLPSSTPIESQPATKPLAGRTVVITRARAQADEFVSELERYGARIIICPTIEISEPESYERLDEAIDHLFGYDWLVFTSVNGVDHFLRRLHAGGHDVSRVDELKVCAIGAATAERLRDAHIHVDVVPDEFKAEGVFAALVQYLGGREGPEFSDSARRCGARLSAEGIDSGRCTRGRSCRLSNCAS